MHFPPKHNAIFFWGCLIAMLCAGAAAPPLAPAREALSKQLALLESVLKATPGVIPPAGIKADGRFSGKIPDGQAKFLQRADAILRPALAAIPNIRDNGGGSGESRALPPLKSLITSPFGMRAVPGGYNRHGAPRHHHTGIDIRARIGWPVVAFADGVIIRSGPHGLSGILVEIKHDNGFFSGYAHLSKTLVKVGSHVRKGEPVGLAGCTGRTTGPHLHFSLKNPQKEYVDPQKYLHDVYDVLAPEPGNFSRTALARGCGPVIRGRNGRPIRLPNFRALDGYQPPMLPVWRGRGR